MEDKIIICAVFLVSTSLSMYYFYLAWFDKESLQKLLIDRQEKLPRWYPLKNYALRKLQKPGWYWEIRILSVFALIFTISISVYLFIN